MAALRYETIMGRERALVNALAEGLAAMTGGPPPSRATVAGLRRQNSSALTTTQRGCTFEVQIVGPEGDITGHIARVTVELDRFEQVPR